MRIDAGHFGSFVACLRMSRTADETGEEVFAEVLGKEVSIKPGENPHEVYARWGFFPPKGVRTE
jgi:hypothetical protein